MRGYITDDGLTGDLRIACVHDNIGHCLECDAEGEKAMAELTRPAYLRGLTHGAALMLLVVLLCELIGRFL